MTTGKTPPFLQGVLRAILATAMADGRLQPEERAVLRGVMEHFELEEGELARSLDEAPESTRIDPGSAGSMERISLMQYAVLAAQADGKIERSEVGYLQSLGERLGLTRAEWAELEEFSTELYKATRGGTITRDNVDRILSRFIG